MSDDGHYRPALDSPAHERQILVSLLSCHTCNVHTASNYSSALKHEYIAHFLSFHRLQYTTVKDSPWKYQPLFTRNQDIYQEFYTLDQDFIVILGYLCLQIEQICL